jgi:hypothetical protein
MTATLTGERGPEAVLLPGEATNQCVPTSAGAPGTAQIDRLREILRTLSSIDVWPLDGVDMNRMSRARIALRREIEALEAGEVQR